MQLIGAFRGVNSNEPNDTFNIRIKLIRPFPDWYKTQLINFPKGCNDSLYSPKRFNVVFRTIL